MCVCVCWYLDWGGGALPGVPLTPPHDQVMRRQPPHETLSELRLSDLSGPHLPLLQNPLEERVAQRGVERDLGGLAVARPRQLRPPGVLPHRLKCLRGAVVTPLCQPHRLEDGSSLVGRLENLEDLQSGTVALRLIGRLLRRCRQRAGGGGCRHERYKLGVLPLDRNDVLLLGLPLHHRLQQALLLHGGH
eukprot:1182225-Prorocentrum_minimum.AAC.1